LVTSPSDFKDTTNQIINLNSLPNIDSVPVKEEVSSCDYVKDEMMVEIGKMNFHNLNIHALVFSEGWPSWSMALEGLGFKSINTHCTFDSITSREEFKATSFGTTIVTNAFISTWLNTSVDDGIIFIQGSKGYYERIVHMIGETSENYKMVFVCSDPNFYSLDTFRVSHSEVGAVLSSSWSVFINNLNNVKIQNQSIRRVIHQIIDPVQGPASAKSINEYGDQSLILSTGNLLPFGKSNLLIQAPSVYTRGDLVTRFLSPKELMNAYDLELTIQKELSSFWKSENLKPSFSFVKQVPIKVLQTVATAVVDSLVCINEIDDKSMSSNDSGVTL
jgi:hypothetical protein